MYPLWGDFAAGQAEGFAQVISNEDPALSLKVRLKRHRQAGPDLARAGFDMYLVAKLLHKVHAAPGYWIIRGGRRPHRRALQTAVIGHLAGDLFLVGPDTQHPTETRVPQGVRDQLVDGQFEPSHLVGCRAGQLGLMVQETPEER